MTDLYKRPKDAYKGLSLKRQENSSDSTYEKSEEVYLLSYRICVLRTHIRYDKLCKLKIEL